MATSIERVRIGSVEPGQWICNVDDDELETNDAINEAYAAGDQEWVLVVSTRGHADVGTVVTRDPDGEECATPCDWSQWTWRLVGHDGKPHEVRV